MNLGDPVGLAGDHTGDIHQDSDGSRTDNGKDEVVHTTSGGISILTIAVEEHGRAVEHAGKQTEDVADDLLRELRSGSGQVEVKTEEVATDAEAEELSPNSIPMNTMQRHTHCSGLIGSLRKIRASNTQITGPV